MNIEPGDIKILKATISKIYPGQQAEVDITAQVKSIDIYEDMTEPSMMVELFLVDAINLVQDFPIIGEEMITLSYITPGRDIPSKKGFNVYSVQGQGVDKNSQSSMYTIKAVTPLHYHNSSITIEKAYNDTVDVMVSDILKNTAQEAEVSSILVNTEKTRGLLPITIPGLSPLHAIDYLRQKAVSAKYVNGGAYTFFENQYGYQFKSIEAIIEEGREQVATKEFTFAPDTKSDKQRDQYAYRNILRYLKIQNFDIVKNIYEGVYNNTVEAFDLITKQSRFTNFDIGSKARNFVATDKSNRLPNSPQMIEKFGKKGSSKYFIPADASKGSDYLDSTIGSKNAFQKMFNQNRARIMINGDNYISAGDLIKLNLPELSGTTEKKSYDTMNSGNYLIERLRHNILFEERSTPKHRIAMDVVRMGYK